MTRKNLRATLPQRFSELRVRDNSVGPPKRDHWKINSLFYETWFFSESWPRVVDLTSSSSWSEEIVQHFLPLLQSFAKCWDAKDGSSKRSGPQQRRMFLFGAYRDKKMPRQKGQDRPYCFARLALQAQVQRLPNSCRNASPGKQNAAHEEASEQLVHQRKKEDLEFLNCMWRPLFFTLKTWLFFGRKWHLNS